MSELMHLSTLNITSCLAIRPNISSGTSYTLPWRNGGPQKTRNELVDEHPRVIFISSRVPAAEVCQTLAFLTGAVRARFSEFKLLIVDNFSPNLQLKPRSHRARRYDHIWPT